MVSMNKELYKNIVFGAMSWFKHSGRKVVYRTEVSEAFRLQGAVTIGQYEEVIGVELSDMMQEFAVQNGGVLIKDRINPADPESAIIKGSVRVQFN
jgi:hypothetical protein